MRPSAVFLRNLIEDKRRRVAQLEQAYHKASIYLDQWVQDNFKTEGSRVGGWAPFKESTLRAMASSDPGRAPPRLLQKTGRLRLSYKPFFNSKTGGIGSELPYAKFHQLGTSRGLPQRRMVPEKGDPKGEVTPRIKEIIAEHVNKEIKR